MIHYGFHLYTYVREMNDNVWDLLPKLRSSDTMVVRCR